MSKPLHLLRSAKNATTDRAKVPTQRLSQITSVNPYPPFDTPSTLEKLQSRQLQFLQGHANTLFSAELVAIRLLILKPHFSATTSSFHHHAHQPHHLPSQHNKMSSVESRTMELYGRGTNLLIISILFAFTAFLLVMSRLMSRVTAARKLGTDDYAIFLSIVGIGRSDCSKCLINLDHRSSQLGLPSAIASVCMG